MTRSSVPFPTAARPPPRRNFRRTSLPRTALPWALSASSAGGVEAGADAGERVGQLAAVLPLRLDRPAVGVENRNVSLPLPAEQSSRSGTRRTGGGVVVAVDVRMIGGDRCRSKCRYRETRDAHSPKREEIAKHRAISRMRVGTWPADRSVQAGFSIAGSSLRSHLRRWPRKTPTSSSAERRRVGSVPRSPRLARALQ